MYRKSGESAKPEWINHQEVQRRWQASAETMALYQSRANPMSGCLPALLQLPCSTPISFFPVLLHCAKSFLWADDLSSYDSVYDCLLTFRFMATTSAFFHLASMAIFFYTDDHGTAAGTPAAGMPNMKFIFTFCL